MAGMDYQIQPNSRRCVATGRELQAGERFFSALVEENHSFVRKDYCTEAWRGPPSGAFSFWTGKVSASDDRTKPRFDDDLLEECFTRLEGQAEQSRVNFRYVVGLLLMRRRRFRYETSVHENGVEKMILRCLRTDQKHEVVNPHLTDDEMAQVQEEVFNVLGWK
jgi:hypothetical protein